MTLGILLLAVGVADFLRPADRRATNAQLLRSLAVGVWTVAFAGWAAGAPTVTALVATIGTAGWILLSQFRKTWILALIWVGLFGIGAFLAGGSANAIAPIATSLPTMMPRALADTTVDQLVLAVGAVAALINSSNLVVRIVTSYLPNPVPVTRATTALPEHDSVEPGEAENTASIKGGRFLGPLERIAILGLVVSGNPAGVAVVVTAKSVIRFSEINASNNRAYDAEYYLVGSGLSWLLGLVGAATVLIR